MRSKHVIELVVFGVLADSCISMLCHRPTQSRTNLLIDTPLVADLAAAERSEEPVGRASMASTSVCTASSMVRDLQCAVVHTAGPMDNGSRNLANATFMAPGAFCSDEVFILLFCCTFHIKIKNRSEATMWPVAAADPSAACACSTRSGRTGWAALPTTS